MLGDPAPFDVVRSTAASRHIIETAMSRGLDEASCLAGSGLSPSDIRDPIMPVRADQEITIIRNVISHLGDRAGLGRDAGARSTLADTGILGYAMMASPTFGDALQVACRYVALTPSYFSVARIEVAGPHAILFFDTTTVPADVHQFMFERDLALLMRLLPTLLGQVEAAIDLHIELTEVRLPIELVHVDDLKLTVENSNRNALSFPAALISRPMPVADAQTAAVCIRQCEELLNRRRLRRGLSATVRSRMIQTSSAIPSRATVAKELAITQRTLHRRLAAEGTSYQSLLDEVRSTLAAEMLDSGLTVEETARRLGYSEASAFTHAHVRWTGHPPSRRPR